MKRLVRRIVLSVAALSPGVASLTMQEIAASFAVMLIGLTGLISVTVAVLAVSPKINETLNGLEAPDTDYPSLLTQAALESLQAQDLDPTSLRAQLHQFLSQAHGAKGFVTFDDQVAMVLAQVMAQWRVDTAMQLSDDQARELWIVERLMRSTPAEAGAMANSFTSPKAMLAMRDRIANVASV